MPSAATIDTRMKSGVRAPPEENFAKNDAVVSEVGSKVLADGFISGYEIMEDTGPFCGGRDAFRRGGRGHRTRPVSHGSCGRVHILWHILVTVPDKVSVGNVL